MGGRAAGRLRRVGDPMRLWGFACPHCGKPLTADLDDAYLGNRKCPKCDGTFHVHPPSRVDINPKPESGTSEPTVEKGRQAG